MRSVGASIAFLAKASLSAPTSTASPWACTGTGFARSAEDRNGTEILAPGGSCVKCGVGVFVDEPNLADGGCVAACPPVKPTPVGGLVWGRLLLRICDGVPGVPLRGTRSPCPV